MKRLGRRARLAGEGQAVALSAKELSGGLTLGLSVDGGFWFVLELID